MLLALQVCPRPEVVEVWDVTAQDPKLLVYLKVTHEESAQKAVSLCNDTCTPCKNENGSLALLFTGGAGEMCCVFGLKHK